MERTLILIKPDGVQRGLMGEIINRFERRGLRMVAMKFMQVSRELAEAHYADHKGKNFYEPLVSYIISGPVVAMVWEGTDAITAARNTMGTTKCAEAAAGTIRGDFGLEIGRNLVHGSDKPESAEKEVALWFKNEELVSWGRDVDRWIFEG